MCSIFVRQKEKDNVELKLKERVWKKGNVSFLSRGVSTYIKDVGMGLSTRAESSVALIHTIFRIAVIDTFSRMDCGWVSLHRWNFCTLGYCIASSVREIFIRFFLSLHRWKKFCPTKLYRFIRFFPQKLCISIALIDTFLSTVAHLWFYQNIDWCR